ncbi:hypothetical protein BH23ACT11_BH23ACT11_12030 [soil metagenome]
MVCTNPQRRFILGLPLDVEALPVRSVKPVGELRVPETVFAQVETRSIAKQLAVDCSILLSVHVVALIDLALDLSVPLHDVTQGDILSHQILLYALLTSLAPEAALLETPERCLGSGRHPIVGADDSVF